MYDKMKSMKEKTSVWDVLPQWHKWMRENEVTEDNSDVRRSLRMMCDCVHKSSVRNRDGDVYNLLYSWYMPRNESDVDCFKQRYAVLCRLPQCVNELLTSTSKNE